EGADERDGYDIGLRFDGEKECARQKRLNLAISGTATLGKNHQRHAAAQAPQRGLDGADRSRRVLLVDADLSGALQMPAYKWVGEQFALENDTELKGQVDVENRNVERRGMGDRIDAGLRRVDLVLIDADIAGDFYRRQDRLHDQPRPEAGEIVLDASAAVKQRGDQGKRGQNRGVSPDQRVKNEIRAQTAEPAVVECGANGGGVLRPRGGSLFRRLTLAQVFPLFFGFRSCGDLIHVFDSGNISRARVPALHVLTPSV